MECLLRNVKWVRVYPKITSISEDDLDVWEVVIASAHRFGNEYADNSKKVKYKYKIVRFTTFRHQTRFSHGKKNSKKGVKVKLN